jgi:glycosyltransferase involved in cell wall biosynthesis
LQIKTVFEDFPAENVRIVDAEKSKENAVLTAGSKPKFYADNTPDPLETDKKTMLPRKIFWYYKNLLKQKELFKQIENYRKEFDIKVFIGVFSGVLPLVFYLNEKPRKASVIFSNMDSWFSEVHSDMKKFWYRKYYSFNYALENSDCTDFLSPFIAEGVKKRNVKIKEENIMVAPCSFADYRKCRAGNKSGFEIAFSSRLEPGKNPMMFLEAVKIINKKYPEIKFQLLGEGTLVHEIENFIAQNNLQAAVNFQFHKNPPEIFANTSVFVSLQKNTNYPSQSVLEAMACGNAIVATNTGDTNLFINSGNGLLINFSLEELAEALESLIKNKKLAQRLGENAKEFAVKNHTVEKYTAYLTGLITRAYSKNFK